MCAFTCIHSLYICIMLFNIIKAIESPLTGHCASLDTSDVVVDNFVHVPGAVGVGGVAALPGSGVSNWYGWTNVLHSTCTLTQSANYVKTQTD